MASASCCAFTIAIGEPFREGAFFVGSFFFNASSALVACSTCALTMAVVFSSLPPVISLRASRAVSRSAFSNIGSPVSSLMGTRSNAVGWRFASSSLRCCSNICWLRCCNCSACSCGMVIPLLCVASLKALWAYCCNCSSVSCDTFSAEFGTFSPFPCTFSPFSGTPSTASCSA